MKQIVTLIYDTETQELRMEAKHEKDLSFLNLIYAAFNTAMEVESNEHEATDTADSKD
jgi:hypothetical protein